MNSIKSFCIASILMFGLVSLCLESTVAALTPKEEKGVKVLKGPTIAYESPTWFTPFVLEDAPLESIYRRSLLPYENTNNAEMYIVFPTLGLVSPVILIPPGSDDYQTMSKGGEIDINKYLVDGVLHYPGSALPGEEGNAVIFGHSNFYKDQPGNFKTIFADIMSLDVSVRDEMWIYSKNKETEVYDLKKFSIEESYETVPTDVGVLKPKGGRELTVFACTNGLEGRRILRGKLIEDDEALVTYPMKYRVADIVTQLESKSPDEKALIVETGLTNIERLRIKLSSEAVLTSHQSYKKYLLNYLEKKLLEVS